MLCFKPQVSVIIPVYNAERTISACIESVLSQTFKAFELILIDDGSTDGSRTVCQKYVERDNRVSLYCQENKGRSEARYTGVVHAIGTWLTFVDADDALPPSALSDLLSALSDGTDETDIILGNGQSLYNECRTTIPLCDFRHLAVRSEGHIGVPWGSLYRREIVSRYLFDLPREIEMGEDYIFWLRLVFTTKKDVKVVYKNVYSKGKDTTTGSFVWTADYAYKLNEYRLSSIPAHSRTIYFKDILHDRIVNLMAVVGDQPKRRWKNSKYYQDIVADLALIGSGFSWKEKVFLHIPTRFLRRFLSKVWQNVKAIA